MLNKLWRRAVCILLILLLVFTVGCSSKNSGDGGENIPTQSNNSETESTDTATVSKVEREGFLFQNAYLYDQGSDSSFKFGVIGNTNLFEPGEDITYYFTVSGNGLEGKTVIIEFYNNELGIKEEKKHTLAFNGDNKLQISDSFSASKNGIYTLLLTVADTEITTYFRVGVVPKVKTAGNHYLFGVQPYISNTYTGSGKNVGYQSAADSRDSIFATIQWLGCNLVREDGIGWGYLQTAPEKDVNFKLMDDAIALSNKYGLNFMWIIGGTAEWAKKEEYKTSDGGNWQLPPQQKYWDSYIKALAENYKNNKMLIYEIWNEADWEFFLGTEEEYAGLLKSAASIIKEVNSNAVVIPSALVSNWETTQNPQTFAKDSNKYYSLYKELYDAGKINGINVHDHTHFTLSQFFQGTLVRREERLKKAGFTQIPELYVTEAGIWSTDEQEQAQLLMNKILWYRANNSKTYVAYDFRDMSEDGSEWTMFTHTLEPKRSAIAYATLIDKLGNAEFAEAIASNTGAVFADIYYDSQKSVVPLYGRADDAESFTINSSVEYKVYDMYGNEVEKDSANTYVASKNPKYFVFEGKVSAKDFSFKALM